MRFFHILLRLFLVVIFCLWLVAPCLCGTSDELCLSGNNEPKLRRRNDNLSIRAVAERAQARAYLSPTVFLGTLRSVLVQRDGTVRTWFAVDNILKMSNDAETSTIDVINPNRRSTRASRANFSWLEYTTGRYVNDYISLPAVRLLKYPDFQAFTRAFSVPYLFNRLKSTSAPIYTSSGQTPFISTFKRSTRTVVNKKPEDTEVVYYSSGKCVLEVDQDNLRLGSQYLVFGVPVMKRHSWPSLIATALPIPNEKRTLRAVKKVLCKGCAKPPRITGLKNERVEEDGKARLNCHVAGNPIPWVEWFKDGRKIANKRGRIRVRTKRRTSKLVIRRSRLSDRGVYECRAGNVVLKEPVSATASLVVTKKKKKSTASIFPETRTTSTSTTSTNSNPWTTEPCNTSDFCLNGGTCIFYRDLREYVCKCAEGYVGLRCDYKDIRISVGEVKNYSSRGAIP